MKAHVITGGKVTNTIEIEALNTLPNLTLVDASLGGTIGDIWDGKVFSKPPPPPDTRTYQEKRAAAYPPIGDQLDALWKGGTAAAEMLVLVQAVKTKYPKG